MLSASSISTRRGRWKKNTYTKYNTVEENRTDASVRIYSHQSFLFDVFCDSHVRNRARKRKREIDSWGVLSPSRVLFVFPSSQGLDVGFSVVTVATHPDDNLGEFATPVLATLTCCADGKPKQNRRGINMRTP